MKRFNVNNINNPTYWDEHQTAIDYGLRQEKYTLLIPENTETICELGCGLSPFLERIDVPERWGVDFSPETVKTCQKRNGGVNYICEDARYTSFPNKSFDVVVSGEVIEHLENPQFLIKEMERLARKRIILSTPILEFEDSEHLWEFDEHYFISKGFKTEVVESERFKGRIYIFAYKDL